MTRSLLIAAFLLTTSFALQAEDILFIGNSFTFGAGDDAVKKFGGVPKIVEAIAQAKGKTISTEMVTTGGKDWAFHLANPPTDTALKEKAWTWVVIQDYSTRATHANEPKDATEFMDKGVEFYDRIAQLCPGAKIMLYETWAYDPKHEIFTGAKPGLDSPAQMIDEISKNYPLLQQKLQAKDPKREVALARVGEAFALAMGENHPGLTMHGGDHKHASRFGSYLAALVIYATIFNDDPHGAVTTFTGFDIPAAKAKELQDIAAKVAGTK